MGDCENSILLNLACCCNNESCTPDVAACQRFYLDTCIHVGAIHSRSKTMSSVTTPIVAYTTVREQLFILCGSKFA